MSTTTTANLIEARDLTLRYGSAKTALERATFSIPKGRVVGLLGHNGAGKTSLMKALVGLLPARCWSSSATSPTWPCCRAGPR